MEYGDYPSLETMEFVPGWTTFYTAGIELDIMTSMKALEYLTFGECYALSAVANLNDVTVRFLHANHLIENKKAANGPKDQVDVIYLEKIKKLLKDQNKL